MPLRSTDHHVHKLADDEDYLGELFAVHGGTHFFVGKDALTHNVFRGVRGKDYVAAKLAIYLDSIGDLVFFGQCRVVSGPGITKNAFGFTQDFPQLGREIWRERSEQEHKPALDVSQQCRRKFARTYFIFRTVELV